MAEDAAELVIDLDEPTAAAAAAAAPAEPDVVELPEDEGETPRLPRQAVVLPDGRVRLPLAVPVTLKLRQAGVTREERFTELLFHRLTGVDMRAMMSGGEKASIIAFARATRISQAKFDALFDRMDGADIAAAIQVLDFFLGGGRATGR